MRPRRLSPARRPHGGHPPLGPLMPGGHSNKEGGLSSVPPSLSYSLPSGRAPTAT